MVTNAAQTLFLVSSWWRMPSKCFFLFRHDDECRSSTFSRFVTVTNAVQAFFLASSRWRMPSKCFFLPRHSDDCCQNAFSHFVTVTNAVQTLFHTSSWWRTLSKCFFLFRHFFIALWIRNSLDSYHIEEKNKQNSPFKNQNSAILRKTGDLFLQKFGVCLVYFLAPALPQKNGNIFVFIHKEEHLLFLTSLRNNLKSQS